MLLFLNRINEFYCIALRSDAAGGNEYIVIASPAP